MGKELKKMSDLISRSALLAYLENEKRKIKADSKKYRMHEEAVAGMKASLQAIENKVNEMPTAYDVEKVEEELLNKRELYRIREIESLRKGEPLNIGVNLAKQASIEDCIEVVKRGGVE